MTSSLVHLTFRQLEVMIAISRTGSFGAAAELLGVSPVSVSKHVSSLERATGMVLFTRRRGATAQLSSAGAELCAFAEVMKASYVRLHAKHSHSGHSTSELIHVAASEATIDLSFMPRLAEFCLAYPDIEVRFVPIPSTLSSVVKLGADKIDLAFVALVEPPDYVSGDYLGQVPCGLYASPALAAKVREPGFCCPVIWPPQGGPASRLMAETLTAAGMVPYEIVQSVQRLSTGVDLARLGIGACFLVQRHAKAFVESGEIVEVGAAPPLHSYAIPLKSPLTANLRATQAFFCKAVLADTMPKQAAD